MPDFAAARINMVENQVRCNAVTDHGVIAAMSAIPRELFVPEEARGIAYMDEDVRVSRGRYLPQPRAFAKLCQAAEVTGADRVLDVGCATGYSSAVLARLAHSVVALEEDAELAKAASAALQAAGAGNVTVVTGPLSEGAAKQGPYDVIFLNGSVPECPARLSEQLADGGRLVAVIGAAPSGHAHVFVKANGVVGGRIVFDASLRPLPGFEIAESFVF
ncbi:MAG TPA: protein-L-isoaspartate O-methyltransferase [Parvibaculum sp.]